MPHAWYSTKQANSIRMHLRKEKGNGCVRWQHKDGHVVCASMISSTMDHGCNTDTFDDLQYLGEEKRYVG